MEPHVDTEGTTSFMNSKLETVQLPLGHLAPVGSSISIESGSDLLQDASPNTLKCC